MKKKIIVFLFLIIIFLIYIETNNNTIVIPSSAIRLRVIPNSNSIIDQNMKIKVKDYLETNTYKLVNDANSLDEARVLIKENIPELKKNIDKIFLQNNYNLNYEINYGTNYFPAKEYRGITYDEGYYESIVISIGNAEGDNFWCVLFPNLCLADTKGIDDVEYKSWVIETINKIF